MPLDFRYQELKAAQTQQTPRSGGGGDKKNEERSAVIASAGTGLGRVMGAGGALVRGGGQKSGQRMFGEDVGNKAVRSPGRKPRRGKLRKGTGRQ